MYNFDGLWFRFFCVGGIFIILGVIILILSLINLRRGISPKKSIITSIIAILFGIIYSFIMIYHISQAVIVKTKGDFVESYSNYRKSFFVPANWDYVFNIDNCPKNQIYHLDTFSKRKIFNEDLQIGQTYYIYYEKNTKIIVKIELCNDG